MLWPPAYSEDGLAIEQFITVHLASQERRLPALKEESIVDKCKKTRPYKCEASNTLKWRPFKLPTPSCRRKVLAPGYVRHTMHDL